MAGEDGEERFALLFAAATMSATVCNLNQARRNRLGVKLIAL